MLNEIRDKAKLILCENCGRILYLPTKPEPRNADFGTEAAPGKEG
jgi:hypothetical protein